jgi:hypothetical protein
MPASHTPAVEKRESLLEKFDRLAFRAGHSPLLEEADISWHFTTGTDEKQDWIDHDCVRVKWIDEEGVNEIFFLYDALEAAKGTKEGFEIVDTNGESINVVFYTLVPTI